MGVILTIYGVLAVLHILIQFVFAAMERRRQNIRESFKKQLEFSPSVAVVVTVYNEDPKLLSDTLLNLTNQQYLGNIEIFIADDGSTKEKERIEEVYKRFEDRVHVFRGKNVGKRKAQYRVFQYIQEHYDEADIIVTVDSDTVLNLWAIIELVQSFRDENVGAAVGEILALNEDKNFLTKLVNCRYWMAFNQERASQSYFKSIACCSGPISAYRSVIVQKVKDEYIREVFLGRECTYGDDRHLTNLVLREGWKTVYNRFAKVETEIPDTMKKFLLQQLRWNKSFYREMIWSFRNLNWRGRKYLLYDMTMQLVLPFLLIAALIHAVIMSFADPMYLLWYCGTVVVMGLFRSSYAIYCTRDWGFLRFIIYGFLSIFILIPNRLYAIATIRDGRWLTR